MPVRPDHKPCIGRQRDRKEMEEGEGSKHGSIGLQELPKETLCAIEANRDIEPVTRPEFAMSRKSKKIDGAKTRHRRTFIKLDGMAQHPIAAIDSPGEIGRYSVSEIFEAGKEAAEPTDRDADRQRRGET